MIGDIKDTPSGAKAEVWRLNETFYARGEIANGKQFVQFVTAEGNSVEDALINLDKKLESRLRQLKNNTS